MLTARTVPLRPAYAEAARLERRSWVRAITASALGALQHGDPGRILKSTWARDERAATILRVVSSPSDTSSAAALAPDLVESFRSLAPGSAAFALLGHPSALKLDLSGVNTLRIPNVATWPSQPPFVGEGQPAPNVQFGFAATTLGPVRKVLVLSAVSGELENAVPETASAVIGRVLADATNKGIDTTAFGTQADDGTTPPGLLHGATPAIERRWECPSPSREEEVPHRLFGVGNGEQLPQGTMTRGSSELPAIEGQREISLIAKPGRGRSLTTSHARLRQIPVI